MAVRMAWPEDDGCDVVDGGVDGDVAGGVGGATRVCPFAVAAQMANQLTALLNGQHDAYSTPRQTERTANYLSGCYASVEGTWVAVFRRQ